MDVWNRDKIPGFPPVSYIPVFNNKRVPESVTWFLGLPGSEIPGDFEGPRSYFPEIPGYLFAAIEIS